jgi:hypothetical protein
VVAARLHPGAMQKKRCGCRHGAHEPGRIRTNVTAATPARLLYQGSLANDESERRMRSTKPEQSLLLRQTRLLRTTALLAVLAALAFVLAACGSGGPGASATNGSGTANHSATSGSSGPQSRESELLKFAVCMRSHGVPNFPDPTNGFLKIPPGIGPTSPQLQAANQACQHLLPNGGGSQVTSPQNKEGLLKFEACMRKHGVSISVSGSGQLSFPTTADPNSPQFQAAQRACQRLMPAGLP